MKFNTIVFNLLSSLKSNIILMIVRAKISLYGLGYENTETVNKDQDPQVLQSGWGVQTKTNLYIFENFWLRHCLLSYQVTRLLQCFLQRSTLVKLSASTADEQHYKQQDPKSIGLLINKDLSQSSCCLSNIKMVIYSTLNSAHDVTH